MSSPYPIFFVLLFWYNKGRMLFLKRKGYCMAKYMLPFVLLLIAVFAWAAEKTGDTRMMTATQLLPMLGKPDLIIIDVRTSYEWDKSKVKIKGAVREEGMKFGSWMNKYPKEKTIVLYCA